MRFRGEEQGGATGMGSGRTRMSGGEGMSQRWWPEGRRQRWRGEEEDGEARLGRGEGHACGRRQAAKSPLEPLHFIRQLMK